MNARELRQKYLAFFESKGHQRHPSGSLIPYDVTGRLDESLLFNGAGMVQFKPYFRGIAQPPQKRLTNVQKCVRTGDIEEVGDLTHLTFFEMMGNFSFGDYFKEGAIALSWEFMTSPEWLGLDPKRLSFTVFEEDDEAFEAWSPFVRSAGFEPEQRIFRLDEDTNYWPAGAFSKGPPGPCGPNSEMFYWTPNDIPPPSGAYSRADWERDEKAGKWLEIWNDVFIQYEWKGRLRNPERPADGFEKESLDPLPFQSVDTGMGLERTATVLGGFHSVYATDVFEPVFQALANVLLECGDLSPLSPSDRSNVAGMIQRWATESGDRSPRSKAARIIADHARTACFCIADGILPGNTGRGYVLRRLIRRAVLKGQRVLGIEDPFLLRLYDGVLEACGDYYPELGERREVIWETLRSEEVLFRRTLVRGQEQLEWSLMRVREYLMQLDEAQQIVERYRPDPSPDAVRNLLDKYKLYGGAEVVTSQAGDNSWGFDTIRVDFGFLNQPLAEALARGDSGEQVSSLKERAKRELATLPGSIAFKLYDTYGFPLEVTQELCQEAGIEVDLDGFEAAMKEAQERSRAAHGMESVYGGVEIRFEFSVGNRGQDAPATPTRFVGYDTTETAATIVGAVRTGGVSPPSPETTAEPEDHRDQDGPGTLLAVALDQTPFYAESGGEVSDTGWIHGEGFALEVIDLAKQEGVYVHLCRPDFDAEGLSQDDLNAKLFGKPVIAQVDARRRRNITRNHTATHLLHAALRQRLGKHVTQAGSLVSPDHLRFDFTHGKALSDEEIAQIEADVNEHALAAEPVAIYNDIPIEEAKQRGAMALFGEKYGDAVRMVEVPGYSLELCGGCHVRNTAEIGLFKILHEASAASGVRRIEAVTGEAAYAWARGVDARLHEAASRLKTNPNDLVAAVEKLQEQLREEKKRLERMRTQSAAGGGEEITPIGPVELAVQVLEEGEMKDATLYADRLTEGKPLRVAFVVLAADGKVQLVAKAGVEAVSKGAHAGNLVKAAAQAVGGGGGGRPDFATAGGRDPSKVAEAVSAATDALKGQVGA